MLGCGGMASALASSAAFSIEHSAGPTITSEHAAVTVVSGHSCSSGAISSESASTNNHCCKKSTTSTTPVEPKPEQPNARVETSIGSGESSSGMMSDCPLAGNRSAVVTKSRGVEASASQDVPHPYLPEQNSSEQPTPLSAKPLVPNRGHTYLRCCVFLI